MCRLDEGGREGIVCSEFAALDLAVVVSASPVMEDERRDISESMLCGLIT